LTEPRLESSGYRADFSTSYQFKKIKEPDMRLIIQTVFVCSFLVQGGTAGMLPGKEKFSGQLQVQPGFNDRAIEAEIPDYFAQKESGKQGDLSDFKKRRGEESCWNPASGDVSATPEPGTASLLLLTGAVLIIGVRIARRACQNLRN
jgi:hypothetical protein